MTKPLRPGTLPKKPTAALLVIVLLIIGAASAVGAQSTPVTNEDQKLTVDGAEAFDRLGEAVAIDGDTLVVGVPVDDDSLGSAYVFERSGSNWVQQARLTSTNDSGSEVAFGAALAIDGDTIVVGAPLETPDDNFRLADAGAAYVFVRSGNDWNLQARIVEPVNQGSGNSFSASVAIEGDTIAISAPFSQTPASYVFERSGNNNWNFQTELQSPNTIVGGMSVAIDGNTIVASSEIHSGNTFQGAVDVFTNTGASWEHQDTLVTTAPQEFGLPHSVDIDGDTIATLSDEGTLIFTRSGTTWTERANIASLGAVSLSDNVLTVAQPADDSAIVFGGSGSDWFELTRLVASDGQFGDAFAISFSGGNPIDNDGGTIIVGAPFAGSLNAAVGAAYVFSVEFSLADIEVCNGELVTVNLADGDRPTNGADVILGTDGDDVIGAGAGNDTICAGAGNDTINAGDGADTVFGGGGDDIINGGQGQDVIDGNGGDDVISGGKGKDVINGGSNNDDLRGNDGDDTIDGGNGDDVINGGVGKDNLRGRKGADVITGGNSNDVISGGADRDELRGSKGQDAIVGGNSNDILIGGDGADDLDGGIGNDEYNGGGGNDTCAADPDGRNEVSANCES